MLLTRIYALPMLLNYKTAFSLKLSLITQTEIVIVLSVVVGFFLVLLILGVRKSYLLKKENERLDKISEQMSKEKEEYKDFTEGHMYGNK
jgi:hypothetical protein